MWSRNISLLTERVAFSNASYKHLVPTGQEQDVRDKNRTYGTRKENR